MFFPIYIYIAILLVVALLSTRLMKLIKLPNVTGFIIAGIIMGPFVFGVLFNNFTYEGIKEGIIFKSKNGNPLDNSYIWRQLQKLARTS